MNKPQTFYPTIAARVVHASYLEAVLGEALDKFIEIWEMNGETSDPREAASLVANVCMEAAARIAIFGSQCARHEPRFEQWMALAQQHYERAVSVVERAIDAAERADG